MWDEIRAQTSKWLPSYWCPLMVCSCQHAVTCIVWSAWDSRVRKKKGVSWKRYIFRKVHFLGILKNLEILENCQTVENKGEIRPFSRNSREFRDSRDSSGERTPFVMTPFSGPEIAELINKHCVHAISCCHRTLRTVWERQEAPAFAHKNQEWKNWPGPV